MTEDPTVTLQNLRSSIDNIDAALIFMLAERFRCTKQVGILKAEHGMPASDPSREEQQIGRLRRLAEESSLDPEFAEKWFNFVVAEVIHHHERLATGATGVIAAAADDAS
jgi:chorismate mutase